MTIFLDEPSNLLTSIRSVPVSVQYKFRATHSTARPSGWLTLLIKTCTPNKGNQTNIKSVPLMKLKWLYLSCMPGVSWGPFIWSEVVRARRVTLPAELTLATVHLSWTLCQSQWRLGQSGPESLRTLVQRNGHPWCWPKGLQPMETRLRLVKKHCLRML